MKGEMAVVGERSRATEERVTRILGIVVRRSSSEDFMTNGTEYDGEFVNRWNSMERS